MAKLKQGLLFGESANALEPVINHNHVHVKKSTFLAGVTASVHRWFRLTPSFGPDLVRKMLDDMDTGPGHLVLDPFAGAGTTLIEAKLQGHPTAGFEINPFLHFVCETCLRWSLDPRETAEAFRRIADRFDALARLARHKGVESIGIPVPPIHNVYRWWRPDVLKDLLILRQAIRQESRDATSRAFFELGLAAVLVPDLTNVTLSRLQLHFVDRRKEEINVWATYAGHVQTMIADLVSIPIDKREVPAVVHAVDSTTDVAHLIHRKVDRVITSPPYPNRYSYVWNTRPHLYLLGMLKQAREASELDKKTIGGTWGTATSILAKGWVEPAYPVIREIVGPVATRIRKNDNLMANYLMNYFNKLASQIVNLSGLLAVDAKCAYVVGCSELKGVYVETDVLLAKIFEGLNIGFKVDRIERIRRRHSGKDLHESIVYAWKS